VLHTADGAELGTLCMPVMTPSARLPRRAHAGGGFALGCCLRVHLRARTACGSRRCLPAPPPASPAAPRPPAAPAAAPPATAPAPPRHPPETPRPSRCLSVHAHDEFTQIRQVRAWKPWAATSLQQWDSAAVPQIAECGPFSHLQTRGRWRCEPATRTRRAPHSGSRPRGSSARGCRAG
jgi:hypothetical protein